MPQVLEGVEDARNRPAAKTGQRAVDVAVSLELGEHDLRRRHEKNLPESLTPEHVAWSKPAAQLRFGSMEGIDLSLRRSCREKARVEASRAAHGGDEVRHIVQRCISALCARSSRKQVCSWPSDRALRLTCMRGR